MASYVKVSSLPKVTMDIGSPEAPVKLRFVIAGAGLGGLAASIGLARAGHEVEILEQSSSSREVITPLGCCKVCSPNQIKDRCRHSPSSKLYKSAQKTWSAPRNRELCHYTKQYCYAPL